MPIAPGAAAPHAEVHRPGGSPADLASLAPGRPALLLFYKGDCPASALAAHVLPRIAAIPGVAAAAVSQDAEAETRAFAREHRFGGRAAVLLDGEPWPASTAYGILVTPTLVLVGPGGRVEAVSEGWSRDDANALAARAAELAGAPAPAPVSTAADGPAFRPG